MVTYKVTWYNPATGNHTSQTAMAQSIESARQEEERFVKLLQKRHSEIRIVSVEEVK